MLQIREANFFFELRTWGNRRRSSIIEERLEEKEKGTKKYIAIFAEKVRE